MRATHSETEKGSGVKLHCYPKTDSLYVESKAGWADETREVPAGPNVDLDADGSVVGSTSTMLRDASISQRWKPSRFRCARQGTVDRQRVAA